MPQIYREMLAEAGVTSNPMTSDSPERPLKRPRTGRRPEEIRAEAARLAEAAKTQEKKGPSTEQDADEDEDENIQFEDVEMPKPTMQTIDLSSEDDSDDEEDIQFEDVDIEATKQEVASPNGAGKEADTLQLNLTAAKQALTPSKAKGKKQPLTKEEKAHRVFIHQVHLLLLLAVVERRNHWCNDPAVQATLRPLLPAKTVKFLTPGPQLTQFGQTESLKKGLSEAQEIFKERFKITEVGLRRALWAEEEANLKDIKYPKNMDSCLDKEGFRKAARTLKGSRDVGALLFCALLRAVGVEARLVCSLQPLSFVPGGPTLSVPRRVQTPSRPAPVTPPPQPQQPAASAFPSAIRSRLGHPNAADYRIPDTTPPQVVQWDGATRPRGAGVKIVESDYPVFWTEILDVGHQKWQPVDALVTGTQFKPHKLEPPASDRENRLTYAVAMEDDGAAKDVTRRYAKAFTAKTRRMRIDGPVVPTGAKWWRKALKRYRRREPSDLDQIEDIELNAAEAREPMPRNVQDFKDHPIYALERHLRRHEILIPGAKVVGTISAGSKSSLEKIYRRNEVRLTKSPDKWYRMGREIKPGEEPVKILPKRKTPKRRRRFQHLNSDSPDSSDDDDPVLGPDPGKGVPHFTLEQTQLYVPPPVVGGRVPKNKFKNIEVYVPSMVPAGGFHVKHARARHAAHLLGVDYAPALQGFEFKGRQGTAVYNGVVIPVEAVEAVRAVITGFSDMEAQMEEDRRSRRALEMWRSWTRTLTIRRRLFEGDEYWGDTELGEFEVPPEEDDSETEDDEEVNPQDTHRRRRPRHGVVLDDEDEGGGFEPGGFEPEMGGFDPGDYGPGGFEPEYAGSGGFEPGGFEPVDLYAGGFELEPDDKGKGKAPERPNSSQGANSRYSPQPGRFDGADEDMAQEPGGFELDEDAEMAEASPLPAVQAMRATVRETESVTRPASSEGAHHVVDHASGVLVAGDEQLLDAAEAEIEENNVNDGSAEAPSRVDSEDDEVDGAVSDGTEEFFMDEDGTVMSP